MHWRLPVLTERVREMVTHTLVCVLTCGPESLSKVTLTEEWTTVCPEAEEETPGEQPEEIQSPTQGMQPRLPQ